VTDVGGTLTKCLSSLERSESQEKVGIIEQEKGGWWYRVCLAQRKGWKASGKKRM